MFSDDGGGSDGGWGGSDVMSDRGGDGWQDRRPTRKPRQPRSNSMRPRRPRHEADEYNVPTHDLDAPPEYPHRNDRLQAEKERKSIEEIVQEARQERPLVPEDDDGLTAQERADRNYAARMREYLFARYVRDDGRAKPPATKGEGRMRGVLKPPLTVSDEDQRIRNDFEGLAYTPVSYDVDRRTRAALGENPRPVTECPFCRYVVISDEAMLSAEWRSLVDCWASLVFRCDPAHTAIHVARRFNEVVRPLRNNIRRAQMLQSGTPPDVIEREMIPEVLPIQVYEHFEGPGHTDVHELMCIKRMRAVRSMLDEMEMSLFHVKSLEDKRVRFVPTHYKAYTALLAAHSGIMKDMLKPGVNSVHSLREMLKLNKR